MSVMIRPTTPCRPTSDCHRCGTLSWQRVLDSGTYRWVCEECYRLRAARRAVQAEDKRRAEWEQARATYRRKRTTLDALCDAVLGEEGFEPRPLSRCLQPREQGRPGGAR